MALTTVSEILLEANEIGVIDAKTLRDKIFGVYFIQSYTDKFEGVAAEHMFSKSTPAHTSYAELFALVHPEIGSEFFQPDGGVESAEALGLGLAKATLMYFSEFSSPAVENPTLFLKVLNLYFDSVNADFVLPEETVPQSLRELVPLAPISEMSGEHALVEVSGFMDLFVRLSEGDSLHDILDSFDDTSGDDSEEDSEEEEDDLEEEESPKSEPTSTPAPIDLPPASEDIDDEVVSAVLRILQIYRNLFESGYEMKLPVGILTKEGYVTLKNGVTYTRNVSSLGVLYDMICDSAGKKLVSASVRDGMTVEEINNIKFDEGINYYPAFQLIALLGEYQGRRINSWDEMAGVLKPDLETKLNALYREGVSLSTILENMTNCIVLSEYNVSSAVQFRFYLGSGTSLRKFETVYAERKNSFFQGTGFLFHADQSGEDKDGVVENIIIFDMDAYNRKPLFAFEAVQALQARGERPSIESAILGRRVSGKILKHNLNTQNSSIILIGAGQRSGKGVLTLNLLGTMLSSGSPVVYVDGKPDMAKVLWSLGKKYNKETATYDIFSTAPGARVGADAPELIRREYSQVFGLLVYLKALSLMILAATLANESDDRKKFVWGNRPFFIFDEALVFQSLKQTVFTSLVSLAKRKVSKDTPQELQDAIAWAQKVCEWTESIASSLTSAINSHLPASGIGTIWLFQSIQPSTWSSKKAPSALSGGSPYSIMEPLLTSRLAYKILGRGTSDSSYGLLKVSKNNVIIKQVSGNGRHFALTASQKIESMDDIEVFKPFLVINDLGGKAEAELKSAVGSEAVWQSLCVNGRLNPAAAFEGFAELLGESALSNLDQGTIFLRSLLHHVGLTQYASPTQYIYDTNLSSFKSIGEIIAAMDQPSEGSTTEEDGSTSPSDASFSFGGGNAGSENDRGQHTEPSAPFSGSEDGSLGYNQSQTVSGSSSEGESRQREDFPESPPSSFSHGNASRGRTETVSGTESPDLFGGNRDTSASSNTQGTARANEVANPNEVSGYSQVYDGKLETRDNPYKTHRYAGSLDAINANKRMSEYLLETIKRVIGDLSYIHTVELSKTGIVVNNVAIRPKLSDGIINNMPFALQEDARKGNLVELFNLSDLYKFKNMHTLILGDAQMAELRFRRQLGFNPKKPWRAVAKKFKSLQHLYIGGRDVLLPEEEVAYEQGDRAQHNLMSQMAEKLKSPFYSVDTSYMSKAWNSYPARIAKSAVGWTLGAKGVLLAASFLGPWGLLLGAIAGYKVYTTYKDNKGKSK